MEVQTFDIKVLFCTLASLSLSPTSHLGLWGLFLLTYSHAFHYVYVIFQMLLNTSLCTAAFGSLRPEKCPQVGINSSGKPVIQPPQEQQRGQEKCNLPPAEQDETVCTAQVGEGSLKEVHLGQTSKLQEVPEENETETLSSKDEHLQT